MRKNRRLLRFFFAFKNRKGGSVMKNYKHKNREDVAEEIVGIVKKLEEGVLNVYDSENYKAWLDMFSKFYQYSFNNTILICMQKPEATLCNSFVRWKSLGRTVKKGAKGIKILCPVKFKYQQEQEVLENGLPVLSKDGTKQTELVTKEGLHFKIGHIFDVSDTEGDELPSITKKLEESPELLKRVIEQIRSQSDVPIEFDNSLGEDDAFGYYQIVEKRIGIRTNLSSLHTCKTIVHELAHSILHADMNNKISKSDKEIQAESVAYVTLNYFGFDTSDYSFPYVASYSNGKDVSELKESLQIIERCSRNLIDWLCEKTDLSQVFEV